MPYYVIGSKIKVMKTSFFSPFPEGVEEVTDERIAQCFKDTAKANASFILFTDLEKAQEFARKVSQDTNDTKAAYYIDYPPVIEVTLKDESAINNQPALFAVKGYYAFNGAEKNTTLSNIDKVNGYYYEQGAHRSARSTFVRLDTPLTLLELAGPSKGSCVLS